MSRYYIDVTVHNKAGVLNRITSIFSRLCINISYLTLSDAESGDFAKISFGYNCTPKENSILIGIIEKVYDVCSVEEVT
ncbi:MAG: acetolactate synthase small subunit [Clostridia bacterium]|nr:acetolactate synthase small subunit [Clostridia bacterium]